MTNQTVLSEIIELKIDLIQLNKDEDGWVQTYGNSQRDNDTRGGGDKKFCEYHLKIAQEKRIQCEREITNLELYLINSVEKS